MATRYADFKVGIGRHKIDGVNRVKQAILLHVVCGLEGILVFKHGGIP